MRTALSLLIGIHGLIHLLGFLKAFNIYTAKELTLPIAKPWGIVWLIAAVLVLAAAVFHGCNWSYGWLVAVPALIASQALIIYFWKDAKFGTIANVILLVIAVIGFSGWMLKSQYKKDVAEGIERTKSIEKEIITGQDLEHLPGPVRKYLEYVGVVGKPKVKSVMVAFDAEMRSETMSWFLLGTEQHIFFDEYERLFFIEARVKGLPTRGYHRYKGGEATMRVKLLNLIPVADAGGEKMFQAETVTLFNDMCFLAPAALIDKNIQWERIDDTTVRARFTNRGVTISALLFFNGTGQLVNFVSDDRYDINRMQKYRFSTPIGNYREINGYNLPTCGEAVWHYPDGKFTYGKFRLQAVEYNVAD